MHGALGELFDEIGWEGALVVGLTGTTIWAAKRVLTTSTRQQKRHKRCHQHKSRRLV